MHYVSAAVFALVALGLRIVLEPYLNLQVPFLTFFGAVVASTWYGGVGPGLVAIGLSSFFAAYCCFPPYWHVTWSLEHAPSMLVFIAESGGLLYLTHSLRLKTTEAQASREKLSHLLNDLQQSEKKLAGEVTALHELNELSLRLWNKKTLHDGLQDMLHATIELLGADKGNVQMVSQDGTLSIVAQQGFEEEFLEFFREVRVDDDSCCGRAFRSGRRSVISDVESDPLFAPYREVARQAGYRAVQSTPLVSRTGEVLGILSTHWHNPYLPSEQVLHRLDLYACQATDFIERLRAEERLERLVASRTEELVESQAHLRALAMELSVTEHRERKRIASDLHDHLQQLLVLGKLKLSRSKQSASGQHGNREFVGEIDGIFSEALQYTRSLVSELSPTVLRDHGLIPALRWLGEFMRKYDLIVTVVADDIADDLSEENVLLLFQSVRELLINVSKYAETGKATVSVERAAGRLTIVVRDEGKGFDVKEMRAAGSSGDISSKFGLFSIREKMHAVGGTFAIRSARGQGTTATLEVPVNTSMKRKTPSPESVGMTSAMASTVALAPSTTGLTDSGLPPPRGPIRVVLVDDHSMVRQGLRTLLSGYPELTIIGEAENGEEAISAVERLTPDVVVMDLHMPALNGCEATTIIKARHPEIVVIGLSVNADANNEKAMLKAGAACLLTKEAAVDKLYNAIMKTVGVEIAR